MWAGVAGLLWACSDQVSEEFVQDEAPDPPPAQSASESAIAQVVAPPLETPPSDGQEGSEPLSEVIAGSWDAANLEALGSEAKRITLNFGDDGTCEIVVRLGSDEQVHPGTYEASGNDVKIDIPTDTVTTFYDGEFLSLTDGSGETVKFKKLP